MTTKQIKSGDTVRVTRKGAHGTTAWVGVITFDTDIHTDGFRLDGRRVGGYSETSYFAGAAVLARDPKNPMVQTVEAA